MSVTGAFQLAGPGSQCDRLLDATPATSPPSRAPPWLSHSCRLCAGSLALRSMTPHWPKLTNLANIQTSRLETKT